MATVEVTDLHKKFGSVAALEGVTFDVRDGEFFCLLGPSGAGKTTTLKTIAGLLEPNTGTVHLNGVDVADVEPNHRGLAMCFESYALYPQLNVFANMASPLRSPRLRQPEERVRARVEEIAGMLGIDHLLERGVGQLSNGQRQRVALGRVLVRPASAYLLDEPLAHLDAKLRTEMRAELKSIAHSGLNTTTIYVTHDYVEALSLADRIAVIHQGRIQQVGTPEEVWRAPDNAFVAQTFGKPRITLVPGHLNTGARGMVFEGGDGGIRLPLPHLDTSAGTAATTGRVTTGDELQVGIRPRDLTLRTDEDHIPDDQVRLDGTVYVLEHLGRQTEVTVRVGGVLLSVVAQRAEVAALGINDQVSLSLDPRSAHVFLPGDEGKRITH
ncbi:ABC transporter ATP-binding protein [Spiractinospora alimapuensis]|uniref:ABC transporter ATP-binding protein n=1 Tax=Spiractinospora alimapuensis TaxID=2820884 RepID=UPI001F2215BA|nr:ABC transporter ATP-binding protein [Spiractinospora alimapuensis]QVQ51756.1 ABC transporter ATP-binding protein [Spiractinospora alimapuensis]